MISSLVFLLLCGNIALTLGNAQKLPKGKKSSLKVYINTTGDSILMKFLRPDTNTKLEGFVLGYGSNSHSNQYFPLPAEGKSSEAEVDAEPKYLIVVRPVPPPSQKKKCSGKSRTRKPLQMVVGTLSPSSVFLSWGFLINPQYDWTLPTQCPNDRLYTVRYREKDKEKKWIFQLCPATETVVENLKPNTIYEFGVKDNLEGGLWSRIFNHKTVIGRNGKIQSTYDQMHTVPAYIPKKIIPITVIKQVIQNVTHRAASKSPDKPSVGGTILVHLIIPGLNETTLKGPPPVMLDISETIKTPLAKNETPALPAESKTQEEKMPTQPGQVTMETVRRTISPAVTSVLEISEAPLAQNRLPEFPQAKTQFPLVKPRATLASDEMQWIARTAKTSDVPKVLQPHTATYDMQPVFSSPPTTDEPEISTARTAATSDSTLDSAPSKTSRTIEQPRATLAPNETLLLPQKPKISASPETQHTTFASTQTTSIPSTPKRQRPKIRPTGTKRVKSSTTSESTPKSKPTSLELESQTAKPAPKEILPGPPKPTSPPGPEVSQLTPAQESVSIETSPAPPSPLSPTTIAPPKSKRPGRRRPKTTSSPKAPPTKPALEPVILTTETTKTTIASKPRGSKPKGRKAKTTPRTSTAHTVSAYEPVTHSTEASVTTLVPAETHYAHPIPKTQSPDEQQTKAVLESSTYVSEPPTETIASVETTPLPSKTLALPRPDAPQTKPAPKQTTRAPPKMKTTPSSIKPAPKGSRPVTSKPKITPRPHVLPTLPAPTERHISSSPQASPSPVMSPTTYVPEENAIRIKQPKTTIVPTTITLRTATSTTIAPRNVHKPGPDVSQTKPVLEPVTFRIEPSKSTMAPTGTKGIPFKPKISPSPSQDVLQTTPAETGQSTQQPATTKTPRTPKRTRTTQAPHKVYTTTIRRRPIRPSVRPAKNRTISGTDRPKPNGISQETGYTKPISGNVEKPLSVPKNVSLDATKKPGTEADIHRPTLPPPKSTQPQRKPLPPNNVTGKPGSTGTILLPRVTSPPPKVTVKPTGPTMPKKIETDKKQPTVSVTGEYGNLTDFSSSPTRETDSLGNQRFMAPHVKYIPKPEDEPCSITDSVKRFPKEEVSDDSPTSPPQNPPTNLTVVTVEGCSSFVILDWEKPQNDTVTEYEVRSKENGEPTGKKESVQTTNQTFSTIENLKPNTSYEFQVTPRNPLGEGPPSKTVAFSTESADPRVSEPILAGRDAIWTEIPFKSDSYSECKGKQYVKRTWYKKFVGVQLCNSLRYKIYLSDSLTGKFYNIGDQRGHGEDHCQFVDSFLDGRTGQQLSSDQLPIKEGYFRAVRQEPVQFGEIGGHTQINYVQWYECGTTIPGKW
ncbi:target of Nesh-SH3 isoform X20 [Vombatus ursinus]|uniref:target of Nesh-SH3 isoform X20 n=1 Tax=Vombatus ursinus TaxID=29139 RepID=UPI000FFD4C04|nr:target of Nesh-SH3 isoform X20 [Vombatus ursinus]